MSGYNPNIGNPHVGHVEQAEKALDKAYTPSTETVIDCFLDGADGNFIREDFETWLSGELAKAWDDCADQIEIAGQAESQWTDYLKEHNPYREVSE
jgi:hypothetical protein